MLLKQLKTGGLSLAMLLLLATGLPALELPSIFSDHMVLQQGRPVPVWGRGAAPGAEVQVAFGDQSAVTVAGADGHWRATLPVLSASSDPAKLIVRSAETEIVVANVLVGEVWLCSGQSNMAWRVGRSSDAAVEIATANRPRLRVFDVDRVVGPQERWTTKNSWVVSSPANAASLPAVAYRFGVTLQEALDVPVGLIVSAWGGTPLIAWHRLQAMARHPQLAAVAKNWEKNMPGFPARLAAWEKSVAQYRQKNGLSPDVPLDPKQHPDAPKRPTSYDPVNPKRPGTLAAGMISPIAPFAVRGMIWYQGESDAQGSPATYHERLAALVADWREWFENPEMPVGVVQISSYHTPTEDSTNHPWAVLRESQRRFTLEDPHSGLAVALDVGEADDAHPGDKFTVGRRLARWALADVYDLGIPNGGPLPQSAFAEGSKVVIRFANASDGLRPLHGEPLDGFQLAGVDGLFHAAQATIRPDRASVEVRSAAVPEPRIVRYAWSAVPDRANLVNHERLPAPTFELPVNPRS